MCPGGRTRRRRTRCRRCAPGLCQGPSWGTSVCASLRPRTPCWSHHNRRKQQLAHGQGPRAAVPRVSCRPGVMRCRQTALPREFRRAHGAGVQEQRCGLSGTGWRAHSILQSRGVPAREMSPEQDGAEQHPGRGQDPELLEGQTHSKPTATHSLRWARAQAACSEPGKQMSPPTTDKREGRGEVKGAGQTGGQCIAQAALGPGCGGPGTPEVHSPGRLLPGSSTAVGEVLPLTAPTSPHEDVLVLNEAPRPRNTLPGSDHGVRHARWCPLELQGRNMRTCPAQGTLT